MDVYVRQQSMSQSASKIEHIFRRAMQDVKQNWMKQKELIQIVAAQVRKTLSDMLASVILIGKSQILVGQISSVEPWELISWFDSKWRMWQEILRFYIHYVLGNFLRISSPNDRSNCNTKIRFILDGWT